METQKKPIEELEEYIFNEIMRQLRIMDTNQKKMVKTLDKIILNKKKKNGNK